MTEFISGPTMVIQWIYSGGTITLNTDYTTCAFSPSVDMVDITAGADTHRKRLTAIKDATASLTIYEQSGGTALATALGLGVSGTLIIGPEGTATGKRKITMPAFCNGAQYSYPFADKAEISVTFTGNGAFTDSAY